MAEHDVAVSGGRGVVVGDYATVFQSFAESPPPIAAAIRDAQFRALVEERTRRFVGRESVFEAIHAALHRPDARSGYVVVRGEPGIGKTAIAANLVLREGWVHHFNIAPENIRTPRQFLENVCAQLVARYGLDHPTLPRGCGDDSGVLSALLGEAVTVAAARGALPVVVVVDALDETDDTELPTTANRLFLPRVLPAGVFVVVTGREEADDRLDVDQRTTIHVRESDPANVADVRRYVEAFLAQDRGALAGRLHEWGLGAEGFVDEIVALSEGNFMYLTHVLPEIASGRLGRRGTDGVDGLPRGLAGYYRRHWREMRDADPGRFREVQRPVLCFLAVTHEPVSVKALATWTGLGRGEVREVVEEWREFLDEDTAHRKPRYRVYHRSFSEFLDEQEDLRWYHDRIAASALEKIPGLHVPEPGAP